MGGFGCGYYLLLPALGLETGYNVSPVAIAAYYALWTATALVAFWSLYRGWWMTG
jgi:hypothetical protein